MVSSRTSFVDNDGLIEACLADKAPKSQEMYRRWLGRFKEWCADHTDGLLDATSRDIERFLAVIADKGYSPATMTQAHTALRGLFNFAATHDLIERSPMSSIEYPKLVLAKPAVLSKAALSELLTVANRLGTKEGAVIALLGINGLKPTEIAESAVTDLSRRGDFWVLRLPSRGMTTFTVLPEVTSVPLLAEVSDRSQGPLILNELGKTMKRNSLAWITTKVGSHAGIAGVTPQVLRNTMVALALQLTGDMHGVQEAAGYSDFRQLGRISSGDSGTRGHVSVRLANALEATLASEYVLEQAEFLIRDPEVHPIAPIVLAGAMLEARLRSECVARGLKVDGKGGIDKYATALKGVRLLTRDDFRSIQRLGDLRNDAAHGIGLETLGSAKAAEMVVGVRALLRKLPNDL
jgi:site-specific recombinase XerD